MDLADLKPVDAVTHYVFGCPISNRNFYDKSVFLKKFVNCPECLAIIEAKINDKIHGQKDNPSKLEEEGE